MNSESLRSINIPKIDKEAPPVRTGELVGKDGKILLADFTPVSLTMNNREIRAGSSGVQGCNCSNKPCGTLSASICC